MRKEYERLKRRPFLMPVWLTVVGAVVLVGAGLWTVLAASTTLVVVVPAESPERARVVAGYLVSGGREAGRVPEAVVAADSAAARAYAERLGAALGLAPVFAPSGDPGALVALLVGRHRGGHVILAAEPADLKSTLARLGVADAEVPSPGEVALVAVPRFSRPAGLRLTVP